MSGLLPVDEALGGLLDGPAPLPAVEVPIGEAAERVLASDIHALRTQPPFDTSAMDGYAVRSQDIASVPARLQVVGEAAAGGRFEGRLRPGEAVRIFTGAPIPQGADTILIQENAARLDEQTIEARETSAAGRHIRLAGLDFETGDKLLEAGRMLDPAALSLAAAANHATLPVVRAPLVAILATGTELVAPGTEPGPNQIVASNGYGVAAVARASGAQTLDLGIVPDEKSIMAAAIGRAIDAGADVIVTLGGASVGDHDLVREVLTGEGMALDFWKIAMRPGKPLMFGRLGATRVLGLPGNPASSLVCAHLFLKPLVASLAGRPVAADIRDALLASPMPANDGRRDYVRASVVERDGKLYATPFGVQDSSMLKTMAAANALLIREVASPEARAGDACRVLMMR